jgi:hypothetical protein
MLKFNDYLKEAALSAKQKKIAAVAGDKDKIDAADLAALRAGKKPVDEAGCYGKDMKKSVKEETEELDEGKMKDIYTSMMDHADKKGYKSHKEFTSTDYDTVGKQHGISGKELAVIAGHKTAAKVANEAVDTVKKAVSNPPPFDPDPKPAGKVTPGKYGQGPSQAKHLAKKGLASLTKEETEAIEEKLSQIDELSKNTLGSYVKRSANQAIIKSLANPKDDSDDMKTIAKREKGINLATSKLAKEEAEDIEEASTITGKIVKGIARVGNELKDAGKGTAELGGQALGTVAKTVGAVAALPGATKAAYQQGKANTYKSVAEETVAEENHMMAYVNATLAVMDEGKIDNLRDTQALRAANKSAYDKDYKADDSHPHITLNKGTAYGGSNQKDDEGDEKPDNEKQEKRGRGRPSGSKSGARQKGAGKDNSIDGREYTLHLPK